MEDRTRADHMGMLATVMNALALADALETHGVEVRVQTAITMQQIAEPYIRNKAIRHMEKGRVVVFGCGTGNPFFSTDTASSLRAAEIDADIMLKATMVDGVYDCDPNKNANAVKYERVTFQEVLEKGLAVMDSTAAAMCRENGIPVLVFSLADPDNILAAIQGENIGTIVKEKLQVYNEKMEKTIRILESDYASIRAGRANPAVLDKITVDYYGTPTPIQSLAAVSVSEARILVIQPWDKSTLKAIEKAIQVSDLGINPANDGIVIRIVFPPLTEERRKDICKQIRKQGEDSKVAIRSIRRDANDTFKKQKKSSEISEDEQKTLEGGTSWQKGCLRRFPQRSCRCTSA